METGNLRNEDFRKLLTQKRTAKTETSAPEKEKQAVASTSFTHKQAHKNNLKKKGGHGHKKKEKPKTEEEDEEDNDARLKEILKNYRDRAEERRRKGDEPDQDPQLAAAYRAVPGDRRAAHDAHEFRKQVIEESKYLGGDMEHTHLVKGLDYSLLHKVRSEITKQEGKAAADGEDDELELALKSGSRARESEVEKPSDNIMVRNINRILFKNDIPQRNELFGKGRMAYVVEMEEETAEVPTTLLRSVHDCPITESNANVNANNMLIQKLEQVLSYLRKDDKKKKGKNDLGLSEPERARLANDSIYGDIGEYVPKREERRDRREREKERDRERDKDGVPRRGEYFESRREDRDREKERERRRKEEEEERKEREKKEKELRLAEKLAKRKRETEGYDECYPGGMAELAGGWDSDEEEDEKGKKKHAWDEDGGGGGGAEAGKYSKSSRETAVKAAYQFGVKKADGRLTGRKNQEKKLDRELGQINKMIEKRKSDGPDAKRVRY